MWAPPPKKKFEFYFCVLTAPLRRETHPAASRSLDENFSPCKGSSAREMVSLDCAQRHRRPRAVPLALNG